VSCASSFVLLLTLWRLLLCVKPAAFITPTVTEQESIPQNQITE
jgi:hypothetical protein